MTANLEEQLQKLIATTEQGGSQLTHALTNAQNLLQEIRLIAKSLNNNLLNEFLSANAIIMAQLQQVSQSLDANSTIMVMSSEVMLQLTHMYQDAIVPLLTRLHNLSDESDNIQRITAITSLGNEINTCSGQINQFNDKFNLHEKIYTMFGIVLMLSSISMMVAIISRSNIAIPLITPLTILTLGCGLCKKAMDTHISDPGSDLITTSIKKIEPLILDVAKDFVHETKTAPASKPKSKTSTKKTKTSGVTADIQTQAEVDIIETPAAVENIEPAPVTGTFLEKIKGVLDIFTTRK